jgi:ribosomal protein L35
MPKLKTHKAAKERYKEQVVITFCVMLLKVIFNEKSNKQKENYLKSFV